MPLAGIFQAPPLGRFPTTMKGMRKRLATVFYDIERAIERLREDAACCCVWIPGVEFSRVSSGTAPTETLKGYFAVSLFADAVNRSGMASVMLCETGEYEVWVVWAPDTLPAAPGSKSVFLTVSTEATCKQGTTVVGSGGLSEAMGFSLPVAADRVVWTRVKENLRVAGPGLIGIEVKRDATAVEDTANCDIYLLGVYLKRVKGLRL